MKNSLGLLIVYLLLLHVDNRLSSAQVLLQSPAPGVTMRYSVASDIGPVLVSSAPSVQWFGGDAGGLSLLSDPSVMKDLELVDDQRERLAEVRKEFGKQLKEVMKQFGKAKDDQERIKQLQEEMQAIQKDQTDALSNVLLPHQLERIKQVSNQMQMNSMGTAGALQYGMLANELEISEEQKKRLLEIQQQLQKEISEKTNQLKEEAKKRVLEELTADQRAKLKSLTGEEFKRDPNDWQERFGKAPNPFQEPKSRKKKSIKN